MASDKQIRLIIIIIISYKPISYFYDYSVTLTFTLKPSCAYDTVYTKYRIQTIQLIHVLTLYCNIYHPTVYTPLLHFDTLTLYNEIKAHTSDAQSNT